MAVSLTGWECHHVLGTTFERPVAKPSFCCLWPSLKLGCHSLQGGQWEFSSHWPEQCSNTQPSTSQSNALTARPWCLSLVYVSNNVKLWAKPRTYKVGWTLCIKQTIPVDIYKWAASWQNQQNGCAPSELRPAWASTQSDTTAGMSH